jgi:hypothetical protein
MEEIFDNKIGRIETEMTSIYSKEDVIKIITELQLNAHYYLIKNIQPPTTNLNILASDFAEFTSAVRDRLSSYLENSDIVDYNSAEFEINYDNKVELNHVSVDLDSWREEFDEYMLDNFIEKFGDGSIIAED